MWRLYIWIVVVTLTFMFATVPKNKSLAQVQSVDYHVLKNDENKLDTFSVRGNITNEENVPLHGALLTLTIDGKMMGGSITDFEGNFIIKPLAKGLYALKVEYPGYRSTSLEVTTSGYVAVSLTDHVDLSRFIEKEPVNTIHIDRPDGLFHELPDTLTLPHRQTTNGK